MISQNVVQLDGEPIQILKFDKTTKTSELNPQFERILLGEDVRDCPIAVISIAGDLRKGKSFLLSFFLRYLQAEYVHNDSSNWMGDDESILNGFKWRGGSERETTGIWMWSKIFTKILPNGEKIAVMLLDTQGTFDGHTTMKDNVTVFSLSTMLASVQIYNLFHNIQEDDLQHLQLFSEYGKLALQNSSEKPFQSLLFLVRDWSSAYEHAFGINGGDDFLRKILQVTADQDQEHTNVRNHLKSCYKNIGCFLMASPGKSAQTTKEFNGKLKDIDNEFKECLKQLVPIILSPQNISAKIINGVKIRGRDLSWYIASYWNVFNKGGMPEAQTILGATAEANNLCAKNEAMEYYRDEMWKQTGTDIKFLEYSAILGIHNKVMKDALVLFKSKAVLGDEVVRTGHYNKLSEYLQNQLMLFLAQNEAKRTKELEETMNKMAEELKNVKVTNEEQRLSLETATNQITFEKKSSEEKIKNLLDEIKTIKQRPLGPAIHPSDVISSVMGGVTSILGAVLGAKKDAPKGQQCAPCPSVSAPNPNPGPDDCKPM